MFRISVHHLRPRVKAGALLFLAITVALEDASARPKAVPRLQSESILSEAWEADSGLVESSPFGSLRGRYGQVPRANSPGLSSQEFSDLPKSSVRVFDDFEVFESPWTLSSAKIWGIEEGDPSLNEGVFLRIQEQPSLTDPGLIYLEAVGEQVDGNLHFSFAPTRLEPGHYWITAWVARPFNAGGQWFWTTRDRSWGSESLLDWGHRKNGRKDHDYGDPASQILTEPPVDQGYLLGSGPSQQNCIANVDWHSKETMIEAGPSGQIATLACDPLVLWARGSDLHEMVHKCEGCGTDSEVDTVMANVKWKWTLVSGGGRFAKITDGGVGGSSETQQILYYPPDLSAGETRPVVVKVTMAHDDQVKTGNHPDAYVEFSMDVTRRTSFEQFFVNYVLVEKEKDEYEYTIDLDKEEYQNPDGPGSTVEANCGALKFWGSGDPIGAGILTMDQDLYSRDYLLLEAHGNDSDVVEMCCVPDGTVCIDHGVLFLNLKDQLEYEWSATRGTFPGGQFGKEVVYHAPEEGGPVTITLMVRDIGGRYDDKDPAPVTKNFNVIMEERKIQAATVAGFYPGSPAIDDLPSAGDTPPQASSSYVDAPEVFRVFRINNKFRYKDGQWLLAPPGFLISVVIHPWFPASVALTESMNELPRATYTDFDDFKTWVDTSMEHRAAMGIKARALARRGRIISVPTDDVIDFDGIADPGWTPIRDFTGPLGNKFLAESVSGLSFDKFERGEWQNQKIRISGICTHEVKIVVEQEFRVGWKGNKVNHLMTNRDAPWLHASLTATLKADQAPGPGDVKVSKQPVFPWFTNFFGEPVLHQDGSPSPPGLRQIEVIDIKPESAKINKNGV